MSVITVSKDELFNIVQYINLIRAKFQCNDVWTVYPVLFSGYDSVDIISGSAAVEIGYKVCLKFQKQGYEYLIDGEVADISQKSPATVTIKFLEAKKYYNLRKYIRFEVDLNSEMKKSSPNDDEANSNQWYTGKVMNLSKGGAMVVVKADLKMNDIVELAISFESGICVKSKAQILRKQTSENQGFIYGVQFIEISGDYSINLNIEIGKLEKAYFSSLREYKKQNQHLTLNSRSLALILMRAMILEKI